jgi:heme A synthase
MTKFQAFALLTTLATLGLVILGGVVRVTDSGLGCPDWPRCHGSFIPPAETEIWIEWSHRLAASVVGMMIFGLAIAAWRTQRDNRLVIMATGAALTLLVVQVLLGAITVREELPPSIVATHLVTGLLLLSSLIVLTMGSFQPDRQPSLESGGTLLHATLLLTIAVMWLGAYMTESGANFACEGWPLCNGAFFPELTRLVRIHWMHRVLAALLGLALGAVALRTQRQHGSDSPWSRLAILACVLYAVQVMVGAGNVWTDMANEVSVVHLALGSLIWSALVVLTVASLYRVSSVGSRAAQPMPRALPPIEASS